MSTFLRAAAALAPTLSPRVAPRLYGTIAKKFWRFMPARSAVESNFSAAGLPPAAIPHVFENFGKYLGEFLSIEGRHERLAALEGAIDVRSIRRVLDEGRSVFALSMHYGNWELGALMLGRIFGGISVIVRRTGDAALDRRITACRGANRLIDVEEGARPILRAAKNREIIAAAIDEPRSGEDALPFLGGAIVFPAALFKIAAQSNAALIPVRCWRRDGRIDLRAHDEVKDARELASVFETWVREDSSQWVLLRRLGA